MYTKQKSVLCTHYDSSFRPDPNLIDDYSRVVRYDENGGEIVTYEKEDHVKVIESHGVVSDWFLENLIKAGIDPAFNIRTGVPSRIDVASDVESLATDVESHFVESESKSE